MMRDDTNKEMNEKIATYIIKIMMITWSKFFTKKEAKVANKEEKTTSNKNRKIVRRAKIE